MKENFNCDLKKLKNKHQLELLKQSEHSNQQIIKYQEEHDNQIHCLREEMEQELLAERRKLSTMEKTYNEDIDKLQKDFRAIQSELELKKFKQQNMEIRTKEMENLRIINKKLKDKNNKLQRLWEGPVACHGKAKTANCQSSKTKQRSEPGYP